MGRRVFSGKKDGEIAGEIAGERREMGEKRREEKGKRVHAYKRCVYIEGEKVLEDREVSGTDRHNPSLVLVIMFTGLAGKD